MEYIHGKHTYTLDGTDFAARLHGYQQIVIDIGTGLLESGSKVIGNLRMIAQPGAVLAIVLNSSALLKEGLSLEQGGGMVRQALQMSAFER